MVTERFSLREQRDRMEAGEGGEGSYYRHRISFPLPPFLKIELCSTLDIDMKFLMLSFVSPCYFCLFPRKTNDFNEIPSFFSLSLPSIPSWAPPGQSEYGGEIVAIRMHPHDDTGAALHA